MEPQHSKPTLLTLPAELRNHIYHELFPVGRYYGVGAGELNTVRALHALTQVNKHLRRETLPVFLGNVEFRIQIRPGETHAAYRVLYWLAGLENWRAAMILDLTIDVHSRFVVHYSAQPDARFQRTGVMVRDRGAVVDEDGNGQLLRVVGKILAVVERTANPEVGDSGLRTCYIASLVRVLLDAWCFDAQEGILLRRLANCRYRGVSCVLLISLESESRVMGDP